MDTVTLSFEGKINFSHAALAIFDRLQDDAPLHRNDPHNREAIEELLNEGFAELHLGEHYRLTTLRRFVANSQPLIN